MLPLLLIFIGEQESGNIFCQGITCFHGNPIFDTMFKQILTFKIFPLLINDFFQTSANSQSQ